MTGRAMTAEEIAAETERGADESAARARAIAVDVLTMRGLLAADAAESCVRAIEDAVRRDCARRCEAVRAEVEKTPELMRAAPVLMRLEEGSLPSPTMPRPKLYRGAAAGADACACAIRDSIERAR